MAGNEQLLSGVAMVLQQACAALTQLGAVSPAAGDNQGLAAAAAALGQVASQFNSFGGGAAGHHSGPIGPQGRPSVEDDPLGVGMMGGRGGGDGGAGELPLLTTQEFVAQNNLDPWVGETLDLLEPMQKGAVMNPQMNVQRARNPNGIVLSRIKNVVPLDQRLGMFVQINGLSDGVVDRISTLTSAQAEALFDSGFKIMKADNPSGVAMRRITDAIRTVRDSERHSGGGGGGGGRFESGRGGGGRPYYGREEPRSGRGGGGGGGFDRSRTPGPALRPSSRGGFEDGALPHDVQELVDMHGLEWWCGEVLKRLSLWQRRQIVNDLQNLRGVRNPSGVVMSRIKTVVDVSELLTIFIDLNQFDRGMQDELVRLTPEQQLQVINPGIYLQNVRNPGAAVRSRIKNVLDGRDAFGKPLNP